MMRALAFALLVLTAAGCTKEKPPVKQETTAAPAKPKQTPAAAAKPLPPGRSPVPAPSEYAAAREVTVKGSSALKCETKMIREWLRVTCRGKNDTGGTPTTVQVTKGGRGETITFAANGVTSLITPVVEGTDFEAKFSWTDKSHALVVKWAKKAPKPIIVGEFLGAASPLDRTAPSAVICDCHKKIMHTQDCADAPMAQPDCERTYAGDCAKILACAHGEPGVWPLCPPGKRNAGVFGWCAQICGPGKPPCPAGQECTSDWGDTQVCF